MRAAATEQRSHIAPARWLELTAARYPRADDCSEWLPGTVAPVRTGWYERSYSDGIYTHWFNADTGDWHADPLWPPHWRQVGDYPAWRGLRAEVKSFDPDISDDEFCVMWEQARDGRPEGQCGHVQVRQFGKLLFARLRISSHGPWPLLWAPQSKASGLNGSPSSYRARPDGQDLNPVSVKDLSASASPATKEQQ